MSERRLQKPRLVAIYVIDEHGKERRYLVAPVIRAIIARMARHLKRSYYRKYA